MILVVAGEAIGLAVAIARWQVMPHFFVLILLVLYPLGIFLGSAIQRRKAGVTAPPEQQLL
jgi:hypothetical protein